MIYASMQFCGDVPVEIDQTWGHVFVVMGHLEHRVTIEPQHVRAMAAALDAFEAEQAKEAAE